MMRRCFLLAAALCLLLSCGPRNPKKNAPVAKRDFPAAEIPVMLTEPQERMDWLVTHFWDRFTNPDKEYACDSLTVNGISLENLDRQMGVYTTLLQEVSLKDGMHSVETLYNRLDAFQRAHPGSNILPQTAALVAHYLYDPNSPNRSEDLYLPFVRALSQSDLIDPSYRMGYSWDTSMCEKNRIGTPAADFTFIDTQGRKRTLYSIKAQQILLIFGNPDCTACRELMEQMSESPEMDTLIDSGTLKVVDIYIDQEIEDWKKRAGNFPTRWINGYDPSYTIRTDLIYNVRAIPSLYLLDEEKNVVLKDVPIERFFEYAQNH